MAQKILPILPLRDIVVYPRMVLPLFVGRVKSIRALERAISGNKEILLVTQKQSLEEDASADNIYQIGTIAIILQLLKLPDGTIKVLVEGTERAGIVQFNNHDDYFSAHVNILLPQIDGDDSPDIQILINSAISQFEQYIKLNKKIPPEILSALSNIDDPGQLADTMAAHLSIKLDEKQRVLETTNVAERLDELTSLIENEIDLLQVERRIHKRVKGQMEKNQREYYLNEQIKAIQKELGDEDKHSEIEELAGKIKQARMPKEAREKAEAELNKLKMMSPMSAEATVVRNYIDVMVNIPWRKKTKINRELSSAQTILDGDHYGLEKVKERILEYLAVQQRVNQVKGPVLCLVGAPGVGKTSLGQSIAKATNRKFVRISLGGVRDEAEIRGHRRTYIGSMPGKIIQKLTKVGTRNPLFLLDEVDKMTMDFRGDPASALLEVLDPEQNHTFNDHYLEVDYDLSDVMFVATANTLKIPPALLDRMEVIRLSGYTEDEKVHIAKQYLIPKQMQHNGLKENELIIQESALRDIIRYYTREAGVRNLERELAKICRKIVKEVLLLGTDIKKITITAKGLEKYLGVQRFRFGRAEEDRVGQVTGLAWTEVGGDLLTIEAAMMPGKGKMTYTGRLGDIMQESIQAAMSVVRGRALAYGIDPEFYQKYDIHIHVPEGATPKDGPSAGIGMGIALVSVLANIPVRGDVAMTGEITLRGEVLPIGGLKEKLLAALRGGIRTVLIPLENKRDLAEIPQNIKNHLEIKPVKWIDEALAEALTQIPKPSCAQDSPAMEMPPPEDVAKNDERGVQTH